MHMNENGNLKAIIVLSVIAIIISSYLLYTKYSGYRSFCDFSPEISCDAVSQSPYSEFPANSGIPVAGLGIIAFLLFLAPSAMLLKGYDFAGLGLDRLKVYYLMLLWGVFSILFYIYLTYLELYVIYAICPLCVVTFIIVIIIFLIILAGMRKIKPGGEK